MQGWIDAGVPAEKLVMGAPIYGRGWSGVGATSDGLFQSATGLGTGTWEAGVYDYSDLVDHYIGQSDWERHWHSESLVPYLYSPSRGEWISYDDEESIGHKMDYIIDQGLGGVMFWELSGDTSEHAIVQLMADYLRP